MLNFQPHQQEVYPPHNHIFEVVLALAVLELNVQAVFDAYIHFDGAVGFGRDPVAVDPDVLLADHVRHAPGDCAANEVAEPAVDTIVGLVLLLHVLEIEGVGLRVLEIAWGSELLVQGQKLVLGAAVKEHLCQLVRHRLGCG